jgi:hypothetical protein
MGEGPSNTIVYHHSNIFIISMFMLLLLKDLLTKFTVTYTLKSKLTTWL